MNHGTRSSCGLAGIAAAALLLALGFHSFAVAADPSAPAAPVTAAPTTPPTESKKDTDPTFADVPYGPYDRDKLDFWKANSDKPALVIVEIHGGGFYEGDKSGFRRHETDNIARCLALGVSLASINYRFVDAAPLQDILRDSARAIQFLRYNASAWNIDKTRIAAFGESAGAGTSLWLAFHDDLADPNNPDPVLRESTRLIAAGAFAPQASYDFASWPAILHIPDLIWYCANWYVSPRYYHFSALGPFTEQGRKIRADLDMLSLIDPKDPPVYLSSTQLDVEMNSTKLWRLLRLWAYQTPGGSKRRPIERVMRDTSLNFDILHHPAHAQALEETCQRAGVPCVAIYRDTPQDRQIGVFDFLLKRVAPPQPPHDN